MKKVIISTLILLFPIVIQANIVCKDGTISPSCTICNRGCCSRHGGCTDNPSDNNHKYNYYINKSNKTKSEENDLTVVKQNDNEKANYTGVLILIGIAMLPYGISAVEAIISKYKDK